MNSGSLGAGLRHQYVIKLPRKFRNSVKVENDCSASLMKTAVRKWGVTATHLCNDKCTPLTSACSLGNGLFSSAFFDFSFRLHLTFHALFLHCPHLLSLQMAHTEWSLTKIPTSFYICILSRCSAKNLLWHLLHFRFPQHLGVLILLRSQLFESTHPLEHNKW